MVFLMILWIGEDYFFVNYIHLFHTAKYVLKAIHPIRLDNAMQEFIILEEKKVKKSRFWPGFEPAICKLEGHWGKHYTVAAYWSRGDL